MSVDYTGAGVFGLGLILLTYLIYRYARYSPGWRDRAVGRAYMSTKVALWSILFCAVIANLFRDWDGLDWLRIPLLSFVDASIVYQIVTMIKIQRGGDLREDHTSKRPDPMRG